MGNAVGTTSFDAKYSHGCTSQIVVSIICHVPQHRGYKVSLTGRDTQTVSVPRHQLTAKLKKHREDPSHK